MEKPKLPISEKNLIRVLVVLVVCLSLLGGYFHAQLKTLQRRYTTLYGKYTTLLDDYATALDQPTPANSGSATQPPATP